MKHLEVAINMKNKDKWYLETDWYKSYIANGYDKLKEGDLMPDSYERGTVFKCWHIDEEKDIPAGLWITTNNTDGYEYTWCRASLDDLIRNQKKVANEE